MRLTYQLGKEGKVIYPRPKTGDVITYKKAKYKVTGKSTATFMALSTKKTTKITIPATLSYNGYKYKVTKVGAKACYSCKQLKTVIVSDNVTQIGDNAFANCSKLTSITFGKNVKKLGKKVLYNDKNLKTVKFKGNKLKSIGKKTFRNVNKKVNIIVPTSKVKEYSKLIKKAIQHLSSSGEIQDLFVSLRSHFVNQNTTLTTSCVYNFPLPPNADFHWVSRIFYFQKFPFLYSKKYTFYSNFALTCIQYKTIMKP